MQMTWCQEVLLSVSKDLGKFTHGGRSGRFSSLAQSDTRQSTSQFLEGSTSTAGGDGCIGIGKEVSGTRKPDE